ncbi:Glycosyltransferase family 2 protein [Rhodovastum atsumiense]|uniref:Glycosyltransferase family 2 protein n=1 Tax=Rhodovastum atsumiense TaxID=504468 RepID=A0A5M6IJ41_9PROT|nr:glycosyltransferase family 2 protein [Rhodovastum atsumiense]KAA5607917.1 glycosyltransferase family 2 protein [Rhodovastum atsumiense]CAH2603016.1 Glycosyltransferase family 2 protein [Rhodovastum atsumiense]
MNTKNDKMVSAIVAIMRNEGRYILEWVAYHRAIGFDKIVIYDNESTDNTSALCKRLMESGVIEYRFWSDPSNDSRNGPQILAYEHAAATINADWFAFLDADEFLVLESYDSVRDLISRAGSRGMPIALNWKIFGSSGCLHASDDLVMDRFTRCGTPDIHVNAHIKTLGPATILRDGARVHIHGWVLDKTRHFYVDAQGETVDVEGCTFVYPPRWKGALVNHYIVKSSEEFAEKQRRGSASKPPGDPNKYSRTQQYFQMYDRNESEDLTIMRFRAAVIEELNYLRGLMSPTTPVA